MGMLSVEMYQWIAMISGAVSIAALLMAYFNGRALIRERNQADLQRKALLEEMRAITKGSIGVGQKLMEVESRVSGVLKKTTELENSQADHPTYDQASRLIEMGATVEDLIHNCGFPRAEAELLFSLKKSPQSSLAS